MKCMKILLDVGNADVNVICRQQSMSALHVAAQYGRIKEAALLVERGALLNPLDFRDETPLDIAHHNQNRTGLVATLLKEKGALRSSATIDCIPHFAHKVHNATSSTYPPPNPG